MNKILIVFAVLFAFWGGIKNGQSQDIIDASVFASYKDIETGINTSNEQLINIYPNPSNGQFQIVTPENFRQSKCEIYITMGSLVETGFLEINFSSIDMQDFSKGTYILRLIANDKI